MMRWIGGVVAVAVALTVALGLGWIRSDRQQPIVRDWAAVNEAVVLRGSEFQLLSPAEVEHEPQGSSDPIPPGAVVAVAQIRQRVVEAPADEFDLSCSFTLTSGPNTWLPDSDVMIDRELASRCHSDSEGPVTGGQERTIEVAWVLPDWALDGARITVNFGAGLPEAIGFDVDA